MKYYKSITFILAFVLLFAVAAATAADAPKLNFKFTKNNVPGAQQTNPDGINNAGVTVGTYFDKNNVQHGYILNGRNVTTLDDPNGSDTWACGLPYNGKSPVVGYYTNSTGALVGFRYDDKTKQYTDIPGPTGAVASAAFGINDKEEIVGAYEDSGYVWHGFLLKGTNYTTLDPPGATSQIQADGINNKGYIVLAWLDSSGVYHSSLYYPKTKTYKTIDVPGAKYSFVGHISNGGDVVYQWWDSNGVWHGALCTMCDSNGRKYYKFDYPKAHQTYGWGINDKHTISGGYYPSDNYPVLGYKATY
jgi:hypothetical protein